MYEIGALQYLRDPFGIERTVLVICEPDGATRELTIVELSAYAGYLVAYDCSELVREFRLSGLKLPRLIDLGDLMRLRSGISRDQGGEQVWDEVRALTPYFADPADARALSAIQAASRLRSTDEETLRLLSVGAKALLAALQDMLNELEAANEFERFMKVEVPAGQVFFNRMLKGIRYSRESLLTERDRTRNQEFSAFRALASMLGYSPSSLNYFNVEAVLPQTDAAHLEAFQPKSGYEQYLRMAVDTSQFAKAFVDYMQAKRSLLILNQFPADGDTLFPDIRNVGTVTARTLVQNPPVQNLKRQYRGMIEPTTGSRLVYLDFSQFEPGVLASLSGDDRFIRDWNSGDVYRSLSHAIFGSPDQRSQAKQIFLAFLYGMSERNIATVSLPRNASEQEIEARVAVVDGFFGRYPGVRNFRISAEKSLLESGSIYTLFGNRRRRTRRGPLSAKERRWSVSQVVQGTASLIFKEALLAVADTLGPDAILLPMHDAILLQLPEADFEVSLESAQAAMCAALAKRCPELEPRVTASAFHGTA